MLGSAVKIEFKKDLEGTAVDMSGVLYWKSTGGSEENHGNRLSA
jgi:hypothetical protein